jgi:alkaline phosphatase D
VRWQVAEDPDFKQVVDRGTVSTGASCDHTVKVEPTRLEPSRTYYYRFLCQGQSSPTARTRTAPAPEASPARLRFGIASCANYQAGYFGAYRHLANRDDLDAVIHLGDYVY